MKVHVITVRTGVRKEPSFVLGRVRYPVDNLRDYEVKVVKKGEAKLLVGEKGIYVINDEIAEELIKRAWEDYLYRGKKRRARKITGYAEPPVEVTERVVREYFSSKGIVPHWEIGWINFVPETPDFRTLREKIRKIIEKSADKNEVVKV